jgi:hypothetical protein
MHVFGLFALAEGGTSLMLRKADDKNRRVVLKRC